MHTNTFVWPEVAEHDYAAFRSLIEDSTPDTFAAWVEFGHERCLYEGRNHGRDVRRIPTQSYAFARYLAATGQRGNYKSLEAFLFDALEGKRY